MFSVLVIVSGVGWCRDDQPMPTPPRFRDHDAIVIDNTPRQHVRSLNCTVMAMSSLRRFIARRRRTRHYAYGELAQLAQRPKRKKAAIKRKGHSPPHIELPVLISSGL
jgi:hypothetical protein